MDESKSNHPALSGVPLAADTPSYFPVSEKGYEVKPGFFRLGADLGNGIRDSHIFQLDSSFIHWRQNKERARAEQLDKYWCTSRLKPEVAAVVTDFIVRRLAQEHPDLFLLKKQQSQSTLHCTHTNEILHFNSAMELLDTHTTNAPLYTDALDALACQIQEDLTIICRDQADDWLAAAHLCCPNHWAASDKVGRDFALVHAPVAEMEKLNARAQTMVDAMIEKGPYVRFAWGLSTDTRLNHHPQPPPNINAELWQGRKFNRTKPQLFVRLERQVLWGFPQQQAALFTIRTYFLDCQQFKKEKRAILSAAIRSMSDAALAYKGLTQSRDEILAWL